MQTLRMTALLSALALSLILGYGCHNDNTAAPTASPAPQKQAQAPPPSAETQHVTHTDATQDAPAAITAEVNKILAQKQTPDGLNSPFPPGTRLNSVTVNDGVATLDFSKEFNGLIDSGETTEAMAQKELRKAVSHVFGVEKMRVTVEGKPFESQVTDWNTPFPVRLDGIDGGDQVEPTEIPGKESR